MPDKSRPFVLITNGIIMSRTGSSVATRDYALGLKQRGWRVAITAQIIGPPATDELEGHVEIVKNLSEIDGVPDIIHGQHHPVVVPALVAFPDTPAIQLCHDSLVWFDKSLVLERVRKHAAVDVVCRERVVRETGLPPEEITLLPNAVDLERCVRRAPLPQRPKRVLIVAHHWHTQVPACIAACKKAGLEFELAGYAAGRPIIDLPAAMAKADIVIGAARIALEAMAVGCAVIVCDGRGMAGMAKSADFESWRLVNFGRKLLTGPLTPDAVGAALADYDADDATALTERVRATCNMEDALDRLETFYRETISLHRGAPIDKERERSDLAEYLQQALFFDLQTSPWGEQHTDLQEKYALQTARFGLLMRALASRGLGVRFEKPDADEPERVRVVPLGGRAPQGIQNRKRPF